MTMLTRFENWDPVNELTALRNRMDRAFNRYGEDYEAPILNANWMPITDVFETKDAIVVKTELPGMNEKDIDIEIVNNMMTISGERKFEEKAEEKGYQKYERKYGRFVRSFSLPNNVEPEKIHATYANGVLEVDLPKKEETKPKKVKLEVKPTEAKPTLNAPK